MMSALEQRETNRVMEKLIAAEQARSESPKEAARLLLEASEVYLQLSRKIPSKESAFVNEAAALYLKAKSLKGSSFLQANGKKMGMPTLTAPNRSFKDIGGLAEVKQEIRLKIIEPFKSPEIYQYFGKKPGGGILMYGPPGCGKSLLAEAAAGEANVAFFNVKASDLKSKYVGETEKNIADFFEKARQSQPCIVFFDEFESLGQDRMEAKDVERNFISQLLTEMDGVGNKDNEILLLAATNTPWLIDTALLREGRFGTSIFIPPPDRQARIEILQKHLEGKPVEQIDLGLLADASEGFSGADLKSLCDRAVTNVIKEYLQTKHKRKLELHDFAEALKTMKPSLTGWFAKAMEHIRENNLEQEYGAVFEYIQGKRAS